MFKVLQNRALLFKTKRPERILHAVNKSAVVDTRGDTHLVLTNWGMREALTLRKLGLNPPSPILARYSWPGMYTPFEHQRTTAAFLTLNPRAFCFNQQGTGKSNSMAWAADYLMSVGIIKRVLIICPLSIMSASWQSDLFKTLMHRQVDIAYGDAKRRAKVIAGDAEFVIINFDGVGVVKKELKAGGFDLVIIDEANAVKTATTDRWKSINSILTPNTWLWMATGTPASQAPTDAHGLAKMMNPASVPSAFYAFRDMVMYKVTQYTWAKKTTAVETVNRVLQPAIRFTKEECLDLPELLYTSRFVEMTKQQKTYYKQLKDEFLIEAAGQSVTAVNAATNLNKMLQVAAGCAYTDDGSTLEFDISTRYAALRESIQESSHKVLVFVPYKHVIAVLADKLRADGWSTGVISGDVPVKERTEIFQAFQTTPDPHVLLIQPAAAAHGVTLHAANTVVWWGPTTSNEIYHQANARVHRAGQRNPCLVVQLCGSAAEQKLYKSLDSMTATMDDLLNLYKQELNDANDL